MMKKTGAVWAAFGLFLMAGGSVWAEEMPAEPEALPAVTEEAVDAEDAQPLTPRARGEARLESVKDLPLPELKELLEETESALPDMNRQLGEAGRAAQETREAAAAESPEIQDLYAQIRALHERIAALTETLPAVQEKVGIQAAVRGDLLGEMDFRTRLIQLIRQKEAAEAATAGAEELQ